MEEFILLEQRVIKILEALRLVRGENERLVAENQELRSQVVDLESRLIKDTKELQQERSLTKGAIDDLIKNIDTLINAERI